MRPRSQPRSRPRSRWAALATALVITAGLGLAAVAVPQPARAESNGIAVGSPLMGWSTWNDVAYDPSAAKDEAEAEALVSSGLKADGYVYVNQDDFWYDCPGGQGPDVDSYGRWVTNASEFPASGSTNGIQVVANYVHSLGLKFGLYVTPGISDQAASENTPIEGTSYTAKEIANGASENNYNCGGMQGINYSAPGAQAFINSWADEFASWGVDYLKLDGAVRLHPGRPGGHLGLQRRHQPGVLAVALQRRREPKMVLGLPLKRPPQPATEERVRRRPGKE